jgi:hypothetical protein
VSQNDKPYGVDEEVLRELSITAELCGRETFSVGAANAILEELQDFQKADILTSLKACRRLVKYRLTLADIVEHIPRGLNYVD